MFTLRWRTFEETSDLVSPFALTLQYKLCPSFHFTDRVGARGVSFNVPVDAY